MKTLDRLKGQEEDTRGAFAKAYGLAMNIMTGCLMVGLPIAVGYWVDTRYLQVKSGAGHATAIGAIVGFLGGGWYLSKVLWPYMREALSDPGPSDRYVTYDDSDDSDSDDQDRDERTNDRRQGDER